ncbi:MAG: ABC transporter permease [Bacteroidales bacterium]|nr:ABC transporter permease [Bacteroidales bacterium]
MRRIRYILQKEFIQVFRDKALLPIIIIIPIVQLVVLSYTATYEIKNIRLVVVDQDHTPTSRELIRQFSGSPYYHLKGNFDNYTEALDYMQKGKTDQILVVEPHFEKNLKTIKKSSVQLITNAINGSAAGVMQSYAVSIINNFHNNILIKEHPLQAKGLPIQTDTLYWYNPELNYFTFMVPGILVLLVTIIGLFLSSMNVVKEKELGTITQLNVTPISKFEFIAGKLIPFWIIAMADLVVGLLLARFWFGIHIVGNPLLLLFVAGVYLVLILSLGLFISTLAQTMQQSMFISWFFLVIFILMSGLFTPIESMPVWAQQIDLVNPIAYFIKINRMIMLKGSVFSDIKSDFFILSGYAAAMVVFSTLRYRKTS